MDKSCPLVIEKVLHQLPLPEKVRCAHIHWYTHHAYVHMCCSSYVFSSVFLQQCTCSHGYNNINCALFPECWQAAALSTASVDFQWLVDRTSVIWSSPGTYHDLNENNNANATGVNYMTFDPWIVAVSVFMHHQYVMGHCTTAVAAAWPILYSRLHSLFTLVDPR